MFKNLVERYNGACFALAKKNGGNSISFIGSCFLSHESGLFITCSHLVSPLDELCVLAPMDANSFTPITIKGSVNIIDVKLCAMNTDADLAILKSTIDIKAQVPAGMLLTDSPNTGASCMYIGYPYGDVGLHNPKYSASILSGKVIIDDINYYLIDSLAHEGNSGGPLIDYQTGRICGVINGHFNPTGGGAVIQLGNRTLGTDSTITKAVSIEYAIALIAEVLSENGK